VAWRATKPDGNDGINVSDEYIRANMVAIEDALTTQHTFPGNATTRGKHTPGQASICDVDTAANMSAHLVASASGGLGVISDYYPGLMTFDVDDFYERGPTSADTVMMFYQPTAPLGWTLYTGLHDFLAYCTSATSGAALSGGSAWTGSTWTISGLIWEHQHEYSDVYRHRHAIYTHRQGAGALARPACGANIPVTYSTGTSYTGDAVPCSSNTISGNPSSDASWRPAAAVCIVATKD